MYVHVLIVLYCIISTGRSKVVKGGGSFIQPNTDTDTNAIINSNRRKKERGKRKEERGKRKEERGKRKGERGKGK